MDHSNDDGICSSEFQIVSHVHQRGLFLFHRSTFCRDDLCFRFRLASTSIHNDYLKDCCYSLRESWQSLYCKIEERPLATAIESNIVGQVMCFRRSTQVKSKVTIDFYSFDNRTFF